MTTLLRDLAECADEIGACGAGNEAAVVRKAMAEITSLRAQLEEARKALSDIAGASWGQASNGQPMTHKRLTIDRAEKALRALLSEIKT